MSQTYPHAIVMMLWSVFHFPKSGGGNPDPSVKAVGPSLGRALMNDNSVSSKLSEGTILWLAMLAFYITVLVQVLAPW